MLFIAFDLVLYLNYVLKYVIDDLSSFCYIDAGLSRSWPRSFHALTVTLMSIHTIDTYYKELIPEWRIDMKTKYFCLVFPLSWCIPSLGDILKTAKWGNEEVTDSDSARGGWHAPKIFSCLPVFQKIIIIIIITNVLELAQIW